MARSDLYIYIETDKKKAASFLSRVSSLLSGVQACSSCILTDAGTIERYGNAMRVVNPSGPKQTQHDELAAIYNKIRSDNVSPDFTGNVSYMTNREKYDAVMVQALFDNAKASYQLRLRPW